MSKIVLITGCSDGGIGHALALNFAERGLTVFAAARSTANITGLEPYFKVHLLNLDVTDQTSIAAVVEAVKAKAGRLDFLVNNAGRGYHMPVLDSDEEESRKIFEVNFWGTQELSIGPSGSKRVGSVVYSMRRLTLAGALRMSQAFLPMLIASKGSIVNTGSIIAYSCSPYNGIYSASKAALHSLADILRIELAPFSVKVLTVVTGSIKTDLHSKLPPTKLPQGSAYAPIQHDLDKTTQADSVVGSEPKDYAQAVVNDVLAGKSGKVWHGSNSCRTKYGQILPQSVQDRILLQGAGLYKLSRATK